MNIGETYGRLTVKSLIPSKHGEDSKCICECRCGTVKTFSRASIRAGKTKSCGCLAIEKLIERNKKNVCHYILKEKYVIGECSSGKCFYIDIEDYEKIKPYSWYISKSGYVMSSIKNNKPLYLHRVVMDVICRDICVDHINNNKADNRKSNLRIATHTQNMHNSKKRKNNKSGKTGVSFDIRSKRWIASGNANGKRYYIGSFLDFNEACKERDIWETFHFLNFKYDSGLDYRELG